jgi:DNA-binding Lrp family transcriptional regulator
MEYIFAILEFNPVPDEADLYSKLGNCPLITQVSKTLDDKYAVFGVYFSNDELSDLTSLLWGLNNLEDVTLYAKFLRDKGSTMELTRPHMKILRCLIDDARMSISSISKLTGLTPRRISNAMIEMRESGAVVFTIRLTENVTTKGTEVVTAVGWDVNKTSLENMMHWLEKEFRENYIAADSLATEPTILVEFTVKNIQEVDKISQNLLKSEFVTNVDSMLLYPSKRFSDPRVMKLDQILSEAGF